MTGRTCLVHGEYAADGVCRWCEPEAIRSGPAYIVRPVEQVVGKETCVAKAPLKPSPSSPTFTLAREDAIAVHWILDFTPAICPEDLIAARNAELAAQHAALRWERVARRWATKAKPDGHERTFDGTLAFDERCAECRRQRRLIGSGIQKEHP